jgi:hypothetical protein
VSQWTPEQWTAILVAVIGAVASAVASILSTWKGNADRQEIKQCLNRLATRQEEHSRDARGPFREK